ncbi:MAG: M50 family metallopeptidase [Candidatus Iainarchaeum archaeon]|uniref:M50 family metallopeptidase n=1 Tax=Candidatus Iainarchaeum sp. TaxID=3101447 RepID=A0A7T9I2A4_9ARCH|nr:MAG: M50 family metallopeptidase [Candidatus Diapherotrites archaeon]
MARSGISWLDILFPGVIVHEIAHALACYLCGVKVHTISVHRSSGMVVHDKTSARASLLIGLFPLIIGGAIAYVLLQYAQRIQENAPLLSFLILWIGFSIAFHAIPSTQDVQNIVFSTERRFGELWRSERNVLAKLLKSAWYGVAWLGSWLLLILAILANATILTRIALGVGLLFLSG